MVFQIFPLKGANDIEFGMHVDAVRFKISGKYETFNRIEYPEDLKDPHPSDHFIDQGLFCYYDVDGHLEAMEFTSPARPLLGDIDILNIPFDQAHDVLAGLDANLVRNLGSVISRRLSIAILKPDERGEPADTFLAGRAGLYDDME